MSARRQKTPGSAATPLLSWFLLAGGLAMLTLLRTDELDKIVPLWAGTILGTAVGQTLAWQRLRFWLFAIVAGNLSWMGGLMILPLWASFSELVDPPVAAQITAWAFLGASLGGYFSLTERGALVAFWFPTVLWMLSILDRKLDGVSPLLLGVLGILLVGFLRVRETRRVTMWQACSTRRLAEPRSRAVLQETPLRFLAQMGWLVAVGTVTVILTGWIAPHLWHKETVAGRGAMAATALAVAPPRAAGEQPSSAPPAETCCPEARDMEVQRRRVREYFPFLRPLDEETKPASWPAGCVVCGHRAESTVSKPAAPRSEPGPRHDSPPSHDGASGDAAPTRTVVPEEPAAPKPRATAAPVAPEPKPAPPVAPVAREVAPAAVSLPGNGSLPIGWMLTMVVIGMGASIAMRPLRRMLTLRHLRRPLWPETVDQQVSNLWQLMLIGLRDGGFRMAPGEQPQELRRRVGLDGMAVCAAVLERARHGVRVDAEDLRAMQDAAWSVYRAARRRAGWAARVAGWLRWPLV